MKVGVGEWSPVAKRSIGCVMNVKGRRTTILGFDDKEC